MVPVMVRNIIIRIFMHLKMSHATSLKCERGPRKAGLVS